MKDEGHGKKIYNYLTQPNNGLHNESHEHFKKRHNVFHSKCSTVRHGWQKHSLG